MFDKAVCTSGGTVFTVLTFFFFRTWKVSPGKFFFSYGFNYAIPNLGPLTFLGMPQSLTDLKMKSEVVEHLDFKSKSEITVLL